MAGIKAGGDAVPAAFCWESCRNDTTCQGVIHLDEKVGSIKGLKVRPTSKYSPEEAPTIHPLPTTLNPQQRCPLSGSHLERPQLVRVQQAQMPRGAAAAALPGNACLKGP